MRAEGRGEGRLTLEVSLEDPSKDTRCSARTAVAEVDAREGEATRAVVHAESVHLESH